MLVFVFTKQTRNKLEPVQGNFLITSTSANLKSFPIDKLDLNPFPISNYDLPNKDIKPILVKMKAGLNL